MNIFNKKKNNNSLDRLEILNRVHQKRSEKLESQHTNLGNQAADAFENGDVARAGQLLGQQYRVGGKLKLQNRTLQFTQNGLNRAEQTKAMGEVIATNKEVHRAVSTAAKVGVGSYDHESATAAMELFNEKMDDQMNSFLGDEAPNAQSEYQAFHLQRLKANQEARLAQNGGQEETAVPARRNYNNQ